MSILNLPPNRWMGWYSVSLLKSVKKNTIVWSFTGHGTCCYIEWIFLSWYVVKSPQILRVLVVRSVVYRIKPWRLDFVVVYNECSLINSAQVCLLTGNCLLFLYEVMYTGRKHVKMIVLFFDECSLQSNVSAQDCVLVGNSERRRQKCITPCVEGSRDRQPLWSTAHHGSDSRQATGCQRRLGTHAESQAWLHRRSRGISAP